MSRMKDYLAIIHGGGDEAVEIAQQLMGLSDFTVQDEPRWIPVSERLPEPDYMGNPVGVLAYLPDGERCIAFCDNDEYGVRWQCQSTKKPTHWMPLPEPPEAK